MKKILVLDLMNLAFRAYWGHVKQAYLTYNNKPTFLCYGAANTLNFLIRAYNPDYVIAATEGRGKNFRHTMYDGYKSNRKPSPDDFKSQLPDLFKMLDAYGIKQISVDGFEADDIIGSIAEKYRGDKEAEVYIVSGDKDFMQLVDEKTFLIRQVPEGYDVFGTEDVIRKFGVRPANVVDVLAILGDSVDMIPGVRGIGEKGAAGLIGTFGTLENVYQNIHAIKPSLANKLMKSEKEAFLSKKLAQIKTDIEIQTPLEECAVGIKNLDRPELMEFFKSMGFNSLINERPLNQEIPDQFVASFSDMP